MTMIVKERGNLLVTVHSPETEKGTVTGVVGNIEIGMIEKRRKEMEQEFQEYVTFHVTAKDGSDVEMAVMDEFDFENKHYVVGAVVKDDTILDDGRYIYRAVVNEDDFTVEKIGREFEYKRIAEAYMNMDE